MKYKLSFIKVLLLSISSFISCNDSTSINMPKSGYRPAGVIIYSAAFDSVSSVISYHYDNDWGTIENLYGWSGDPVLFNFSHKFEYDNGIWLSRAQSMDKNGSLTDKRSDVIDCYDSGRIQRWFSAYGQTSAIETLYVYNSDNILTRMTYSGGNYYTFTYNEHGAISRRDLFNRDNVLMEYCLCDFDVNGNISLMRLYRAGSPDQLTYNIIPDYEYGKISDFWINNNILFVYPMPD
jgi:hypothetical protein